MADYNIRQKQTITITFGDQGENHKGMQKIGQMSDSGYSVEKLVAVQSEFEALGAVCELIDLNQFIPFTHQHIAGNVPAAVLVVRNGVDALLGAGSADTILSEMGTFKWDTQALMYGQVRNKKKRHNVCFSDFSQEPDYANGKGRVVSWDTLPYLSAFRQQLQNVGINSEELVAEGNKYYDLTNPEIGIGFHGDMERRKVIAIRLGESLPIHYRWFHRWKVLDPEVYAEIMINHGDMYLMSEKAVGTDWKRPSVLTLRHAVGVKNCLQLTKKQIPDPKPIIKVIRTSKIIIIVRDYS